MSIPRNTTNISVKSVSLYSVRFQRHGVLKNVQLFWATLYFHIMQYVSRTCTLEIQKTEVSCSVHNSNNNHCTTAIIHVNLR